MSKFADKKNLPCFQCRDIPLIPRNCFMVKIYHINRMSVSTNGCRKPLNRYGFPLQGSSEVKGMLITIFEEFNNSLLRHIAIEKSSGGL